MGKGIQGAATALGVLLACAFFWLAFTGRSVDREVYFGNLDERCAALEAQLAPKPDDESERALRVAVAIAVGTRISAFEKASDQTGTDLDRALVRKAAGWLDEGDGKFTAADRDFILGQPEVQLALRELLANDAEGADGAVEGEHALMELMDLSEYLALRISAAADRGEEEAVVAGFESLMQLSADLLGSRDPVLRVIGAITFPSGFTSASRTEMMATEFSDSQDREAFDPVAMEALLTAVPSPNGRRRLLAAIERTENRIPSPKDVLLCEFRRSLMGMRDYAQREHPNGGSIPSRWMRAFEALTRWHESILAAMNDPAFIPSEAAFAPAEQQAGALPDAAGSVASGVWSPIASFLEAEQKAERAKRWIAAGTTR